MLLSALRVYQYATEEATQSLYCLMQWVRALSISLNILLSPTSSTESRRQSRRRSGPPDQLVQSLPLLFGDTGSPADDSIAVKQLAKATTESLKVLGRGAHTPKNLSLLRMWRGLWPFLYNDSAVHWCVR